MVFGSCDDFVDGALDVIREHVIDELDMNSIVELKTNKE